jgi:glycosyltransferase involved in cell wall biosynthesis
MKIAWFTPFNIKSAIGRYSKTAAGALSRFVNVDLFIFEREDLHTTILNTVYYNPENVLSLLEDYDICVYNMGDYTGYHASIYDVMRKHPGIIIAHDLCLINFFWGYYNQYLKNPEEYTKILIDMYGDKEADMILKATESHELWSALNLSEYHMAEQLFPYSLGLVVHSGFHASKLKLGYDGPICTVPLLYENEFNMIDTDNNFDGYDSSKINLLTIGNLNPNKRIHSTIEAIASDPKLRQNFHLTCIGAMENDEYVEQLRTLITKLNISENIKLLGFVEYKRLMDYYKNANIIINLRYPALEGGSASLIEQMQLGKTIVVTDIGVYSEMPDDCVIKIDPSNEVEELKRALKKLVNNPLDGNKYGVNAIAYVQKNFSPDIYGRKLFNFIQSVNFLSPLYSLTDLVGKELRTMGVSHDMRICETISKEIELLYAGESSNDK